MFARKPAPRPDPALGLDTAQVAATAYGEALPVNHADAPYPAAVQWRRSRCGAVQDAACDGLVRRRGDAE